jgi:hypothetical protein
MMYSTIPSASSNGLKRLTKRPAWFRRLTSRIIQRASRFRLQPITDAELFLFSYTWQDIPISLASSKGDTGSWIERLTPGPPCRIRSKQQQTLKVPKR